jgi:hypothetical protein
MTEPTEADVIEQLEQWRKQGAVARDTGKVGPYPTKTLAAYMHTQGWLCRDLQLALARANPRYRNEQLRIGNITREGIKGGLGGYPFEAHTVLISIVPEG